MQAFTVHCTDANQNNSSRLLYRAQKIGLHDSIVIMRYIAVRAAVRLAAYESYCPWSGSSVLGLCFHMNSCIITNGCDCTRGSDYTGVECNVQVSSTYCKEIDRYTSSFIRKVKQKAIWHCLKYFYVTNGSDTLHYLNFTCKPFTKFQQNTLVRKLNKHCSKIQGAGEILRFIYEVCKSTVFYLDDLCMQ